MPGAAVTATSGPRIIALNGDNPAAIPVGTTYADLGARITASQHDLNLGIHLYVDGTPESAVQVDTTKPGTHTVDYVVTDQRGLTATSTRTVIVLRTRRLARGWDGADRRLRTGLALAPAFTCCLSRAGRRSVSSSTVRGVSSAAPTDCAMKNISGSKS
jgi:hypothetical protein